MSRRALSILEVLFALVILSLALIPLLTLLSTGTDEVESADRLLELLDQAQGDAPPTETKDPTGTLLTRETHAKLPAHQLWWTRTVADPSTSFAAPCRSEGAAP